MMCDGASFVERYTFLPQHDPLTFYLLPALITAAALVLYQLVSYDVERFRKKYSLKLTTAAGTNEYYDRVCHIRMSTLEQLVYFLPSLWLFSVYLQKPNIAALIGTFWIVGRLGYAVEYYRNPDKRPFGFILCAIATLILLLGGFYGAIMKIPSLGLMYSLL